MLTPYSFCTRLFHIWIPISWSHSYTDLDMSIFVVLDWVLFLHWPWDVHLCGAGLSTVFTLTLRCPSLRCWTEYYFYTDLELSIFEVLDWVMFLHWPWDVHLWGVGLSTIFTLTLRCPPLKCWTEYYFYTDLEMSIFEVLDSVITWRSK
jgi:hypothetical protein